MRKQLLFGTTLLILSLFVIASVSAAKPLLSPEPLACDVALYDFNGDARVSAADLPRELFVIWKTKQAITPEFIEANRMMVSDSTGTTQTTTESQRYINYLKSLVVANEGKTTYITDAIIGDLGYKLSLCSKPYLTTNTPAQGYTLVSKYINTGDDYAGRWYQFGASSEFGEGYSPDISISATLSPLPTQKIIAATLLHEVSGEAWSTSDDTHDLGKLLYPLVVYDVDTKNWMTKRYNDVVFSPMDSATARNAVNLVLYAQKGAPFNGGQLTLYFADGTHVSTSVPPKDVILPPKKKSVFNDGITLGKLPQGGYACFGCSDSDSVGLCIDPAPDVTFITETQELYCAPDFTVQGTTTGGGPTPVCKDTDGGKNIGVQGSTSVHIPGQQTSTGFDDTCYTWQPFPYSSQSTYTRVSSCSGDNCFIDEGSCEATQADIVRSSASCPLGCNAGACVSATSTPTPVTPPTEERPTPDSNYKPFPETIGSYTLKSFSPSSDCDTIGPDSELGKEGFVGTFCGITYRGEYRSNTNAVFVHFTDVTKGHGLYNSYLKRKTLAATVGTSPVLRLENHELLWPIKDDRIEYIVTQEGTVIAETEGERYEYGKATGDNDVTKYFLDKYPSRLNTNDKPFGQSCFSGCLSDTTCYPIAFRTETTYCTAEGVFTSLKAADETCNNNFECATNVCINNVCADKGFIDKLIAFFKRLFG